MNVQIAIKYLKQKKVIAVFIAPLQRFHARRFKAIRDAVS